MTTSPAPFTSAAGQPLPLSEWLALRRRRFPEFYDSFSSLPPGLISLVQPALPRGQVFQGALVLPGEYFARRLITWEYVPERALVFVDGGALYACGALGDAAPQVHVIDARALLYLRSSLLLLYGLLEFKADCDGPASDVRLEYNTVIWPSLARPLARFVASAGVRASTDREAEVPGANERVLATLPFKFANGLRYYALDPGEFLHAAVFQPAIWHGAIIPRQVTPNTLFALTDRKVVFIEEKRASVWHPRSTQGDYGWIFTYIPRDRMIDMVMTPGDRWSELRMHVEWGSVSAERAFLLEPSVASRWSHAWQTTHEH